MLYPEKNGTISKPLYLLTTDLSDLPPLLNLQEPESQPISLKEELLNNLTLIYPPLKINKLGEKLD